MSPDNTAYPIRYFDGTVILSATDLTSDFSGTTWGITRNWTNGIGYARQNVVGNGMIIEDQPKLIQIGGTGVTLAAIMNGHTAHYFDLSGSTYQPRGYLKDTLEHDATNHVFTLTDSSGEQFRFYDFGTTDPTQPHGQLKSFEDADDHSTGFTYNAHGQLTQMLRSTTVHGSKVDERFKYEYVTSGVNAGLMGSVTLQRRDYSGITPGPWATVRKVEYSYYDSGDAHGNVGDLKTANIEDASGNVLETTYYRYFTQTDIDDGQQGYVHGLKYVFEPSSFARLAASVSDPFTASDDDVAPYADHYFEYGDEQRAVVEIAKGAGCSVHGGLGEMDYTYTPSDNPDGYNSWAMKTTESLPDGNENIVYTNFMGQVMLKVFIEAPGTDHEQQWDTYYRFDDAGRLILQASPSAVSGYDDTHADLMNFVSGHSSFLRDDTGLIVVNTYYTTTTATSSSGGSAEGYLEETDLQNGELATPIPQVHKDYIAHTAGGNTIYLTASSTVYTDTSGMDGLMTRYDYTFFTSKLQVKQKTTTGPAGDTSQVVYDAFGRTIWQKDAAGYISYTAYGQKTGAVLKTIQDVDMSRTSDFLDPPAGWSTPTGGGLHLITRYTVDPLGRTVKSTDADGNVTYTVYDDVDHETRVYPGWNSSTDLPTGPTIVTRHDWAHGYDETLTMSATPSVTTSGKPTGSESISDLQSLSRTLYNDGGQAVEQDAYFSFGSLSYGTSPTLVGAMAGVNYYATLLAYDDKGRLSRIERPDGTITRLVRDGLDRVVSQWIGTNDTPTTGDWSPSNPAGMTETASYIYDGGGVGDSLLTSATDALGNVTTYAYDFRGRQTSRTLPDPDGSGSLTSPVSYTGYDNLDRVTSTTDALGNVTTYTYSINTANHRTTVTTTLPDPDGSGPLTSPVSSKSYSARDLLVSQTDALGNVTTYKYDGAKRLIQVTQPDPDGTGSLTSPVTYYAYDDVGNLTSTTDPLGNVTTKVYDLANRVVAVIQPDPDGSGPLTAPETDYAYDAAGMLLSLTDPDGNTTSWTYDALGRTTSETNELDATRYFAYDGAGRLIDKIDRDGRETQYAYNVLGEVTSETWLDGATTVRTLSYTYNAAGWLTEASDPSATYDYTYDHLGRVTSEVQTIAGLSSTIEYDSQYNVDSSRTGLQAVLGSTNDFHNTYAYDALQRLTRVTQQGVTDGDAVAPKRVNFAYNANSQFQKITRYASTSTSELVARTFYGFDNMGRLTSLIHTTDSSAPTSGWGSGILAGYTYGFDAGSRITTLDSHLEDSTSYSYDNTSQLTGADHSSSGPADESYSYDENGNRTMSGYATSSNNRLSSDGTYNYTYDDEGNRLTRTVISGAHAGYVTEYSWDYRNRLVGVTEKDNEDNVLSTVAYSYDINNRRIEKSVDSDGPGSATAVDTFFSWEHDQVALQFNGNDLSHRYLWGPTVDQVLADEAVTSLSIAGSVIWPLTDHLGTVADLATHDSGTHVTSIANHRTFDSYGNITAETNSAVETIFAFTGAQRDEETGLQYHRARYYDPATGNWISQDPTGFDAGDFNLSRYSSNAPTNYRDPTGLKPAIEIKMPGGWVCTVGFFKLEFNKQTKNWEYKLKFQDDYDKDKLEQMFKKDFLPK